MIEVILRDYLKSKLEVEVVFTIPENQTSTFVLLDRLGGNGKYLKHASFAIQSYGSRLEDAILLNGKVKEVMQDFDKLNEIVKVELVNDYNFTDTITKKYRYQAVYEIKYY